MWWLPLLLIASTVGDATVWFLANLALPVSIASAAALVLMWPQCCLIKQAHGSWKTWRSTETPDVLAPQGPSGERTGGGMPPAGVAVAGCPSGPQTLVGAASIPHSLAPTRTPAPAGAGDSCAPAVPAPVGPPPWARAVGRRVCR